MHGSSVGGQGGIEIERFEVLLLNLFLKERTERWALERRAQCLVLDKTQQVGPT
jgi:hypothetical protein